MKPNPLVIVSFLPFCSLYAQVRNPAQVRSPQSAPTGALPRQCNAGDMITNRTGTWQCGSNNIWALAGSGTPAPAQISVTSPPYNAQCNGTYDDTAALNAAAAAANAAGGGTVALPAGTCTTSTGIPLYSYVSYVGEGINATFVKLRNGSNTDVFHGTVNGYGSAMVNYSSAWETGASTGIQNWTISDLTIDGNNVNESSGGAGIRQYGYQFLVQNVNIQNTFGDCLYSDYNAYPGPATATTGSIQAQLINVTTYHCGIDPTNTTILTTGAVGIRWAGPTDSQWTDITSYENASHGLMIGPNGGGTQIATLHSWGPHIGNHSASAVFESGYVQCSNCEFEGSDTVQLVLLAGNQTIFGGHIFQPTTEQLSSIGIQLGQNAGSNTYAGVYYQQVPGSPTPAPNTSVAASSDGNFITTRFDNIWGGALEFINEQNNQYSISTYTTTGAYVLGTPAGTDQWSIFGLGLDCVNTLATCGGTRLLSGNGNALTISNNTPLDLLDFNSVAKQLQLPNGSTLQLYSDNYLTPTYGLGVNGHGLSYNQGAAGYIDSYATGGWKNGGGWALASAASQAVATGGTISRNIGGYEFETLPVSASSAVSGVILQPGITDGQQITVINTSPNQITFGGAATSNVADGAGDTIAPARAATFRWLAATSLWYRVGTN